MIKNLEVGSFWEKAYLGYQKTVLVHQIQPKTWNNQQTNETDKCLRHKRESKLSSAYFLDSQVFPSRRSVFSINFYGSPDESPHIDKHTRQD